MNYWILMFMLLVAMVVAHNMSWKDVRRHFRDLKWRRSHAAEKPYRSKGRNTVSIPPMSEMTPEQRKNMEEGYRRYYGGSGKNIHSS